MSKRKLFQIGDSLTGALEETVQAADNYSGQLRIEILPLRKIDVDPDNPRDMVLDFSDILSVHEGNSLDEKKKNELESLRSMAESINRDGLINPVVVYKYGDKYRLVAGERRALASTLAKQEYIPAKILEKKPSELSLRLLQWVENVERENLSLWERLKNLEKIISANKEDGKMQGEMSPTRLSEIIGCTLPHAMNYCYVINADGDLKKAIEENKIKNLEKAALIAQVKYPTLKLEAMNACIEGATLKQLKKIILEGKEKMEQKEKGGIALNQPKPGRQAMQVNLGKTKNTAGIKVLIDLVVQNDKYHFLKAVLANLNWDDFGAVSKAFQHVLQTLEKKA